MKKLILPIIILALAIGCKKEEYRPCKKELTKKEIKKIFRDRLISKKGDGRIG